MAERHGAAGTARFTGHKAMTVDLNDGGPSELTADRFVLAAGSRPVIPDIPGWTRTSSGAESCTPRTRSCGSTNCRDGSSSSAAATSPPSSPTSSPRSAPRSPSWSAARGCCATMTPTSPPTFTEHAAAALRPAPGHRVCGVKPPDRRRRGRGVRRGPGRRDDRRRRRAAAGDRPAAELRPAQPAGHRRDGRRRRPGDRRRVPARPWSRASTRSATSARRTRSSTSPTTRPGSSGTT